MSAGIGPGFAHRPYFIDKELLYLFSLNAEFALSFEEIGLVPGGLRLNLTCVPETSRVFNVLRERTVGMRGYPAVTGRLIFGEDPVLVSDEDAAIASVRGTIETDDGAYIDTTYYGVMPLGPGGFRGIAAGVDPIGSLDAPAEYPVVVTPTYQTEAPDYQWLTEQQCVGFGRVERIGGIFRRLSYDVYAMT